MAEDQGAASVEVEVEDSDSVSVSVSAAAAAIAAIAAASVNACPHKCATLSCKQAVLLPTPWHPLSRHLR